jgi:hypothetical protein
VTGAVATWPATLVTVTVLLSKLSRETVTLALAPGTSITTSAVPCALGVASPRGPCTKAPATGAPQASLTRISTTA